MRSAKAGASILGNIFLVLGYGRSPKVGKLIASILERNV